MARKRACSARSGGLLSPFRQTAPARSCCLFAAAARRSPPGPTSQSPGIAGTVVDALSARSGGYLTPSSHRTLEQKGVDHAVLARSRPQRGTAHFRFQAARGRDAVPDRHRARQLRHADQAAGPHALAGPARGRDRRGVHHQAGHPAQRPRRGRVQGRRRLRRRSPTPPAASCPSRTGWRSWSAGSSPATCGRSSAG